MDDGHRAVCVGSYDPVHRGHLDIIRRATELFDAVCVAVAANPTKTSSFALEDRVEMVRASTQQYERCTVEAMSEGLLVNFCRERRITTIVKGLRSGKDFDYERSMARMNWELGGVETVFLSSGENLSHLSSSMIKEIAALGGDVSPYVPPPVLQGIEQKWCKVSEAHWEKRPWDRHGR